MCFVILYKRRRVLEFLLTAAAWNERLKYYLLQFAISTALRKPQFPYNGNGLAVLLNFCYELANVLILQLEGIDL